MPFTRMHHECWETDEPCGEPCEWTYTDATACRHDPDECCEACEETDSGMWLVLVTASRTVGDRVGAPGGSSWEIPPEPEQDAYCTFFVDADADPQSMLEAEGFAPTEVA